MKLIKKSELIIKKSKFIGLYYEVNYLLEVNTILEKLKKEYKKARHIPYGGRPCRLCSAPGSRPHGQTLCLRR